MGSYYYLVAQLPALSFGTVPAMGSKDFIALASYLMTAPDADLLAECSLVPFPAGDDPLSALDSTGSALIDGWRAWEGALRLNMAKLRAQNLKRDGAGNMEVPADPLNASSAARAAMAIESPLDADMFLDRARWDAIEAFQGFDYFGRDTVYAYLLKLFLLERRALFKVEEGFAEYSALYASIMEAAPYSNESGEPK